MERSIIWTVLIGSAIACVPTPRDDSAWPQDTVTPRSPQETGDSGAGSLPPSSYDPPPSNDDRPPPPVDAGDRQPEATPDAGSGSTTPDAGAGAWTCTPSYYDARDGCDCNCGVQDPDCDVEGQTVYGCETGERCTGGVCTSATGGGAPDAAMGGVPDAGTGTGTMDAGAGPPATWTCSTSYWDARDGCDCNCGAIDPDCSVDGQSLYGCSSGESCIMGLCQADPASTPDAGMGTTADAGTTTGPPAEWTCTPSYYGTLDGCDCNCGIRDPDCDVAGQTLYRCMTGQTCNADGVCE